MKRASQREPRHEMQHAASPTWCIHCGTFDVYRNDEPCTDDRSGKFDSRKAENFKRMAESIGLGAAPAGRAEVERER